MEVEFVGPYDRDKCHFCGKSDKTHPTESSKNVAGFSRAEDDKPTGPFFDACYACGIRPYPSVVLLQSMIKYLKRKRQK